MRRKISTGSRFEELAGYSRAVVDGDWVFISGTVGVDPATGKMPESASDQTRLIFDIIENVLADAQFSLEDVVTARIYLTDAAILNDVIAVVGEKFRTIRPTNTTIICQLPVPGAKLEIEVTARKHKQDSGLQ